MRTRSPQRDGRRPLRGRGPEEGFTAVEMAIAMGLMVTISIMGFQGVQSLFGVATTTLNNAQSATTSASAVNELRQEILSGNILFDPNDEFNGTSNPPGQNCAYPTTIQHSDEHTTNMNCAGNNPDGSAIPPGFSLRIYTQNNGSYTCVQWRLLNRLNNATGVLETRQWNPLTGAQTAWATVVTGVVNYAPPSSVSPQGAPVAPFVLNSASSYGGRLLDVDLILEQTKVSLTPVVIKSSISGRDAWNSSSTQQCYPVPTP